MTLQINVSGPVKVRVGTGTADALETLGYSVDGVEVSEQAYWHDVHGDEHGGTAGPPIDTQYLGRTVRIRMELSKFDRDVARKIQGRVKSARANYSKVESAHIGLLAFQDDEATRVLLESSSNPLNFPVCIPRRAIETGEGTKYSTLLVEFEAHRRSSDDVLWDTTTT